jgi:hypothetical protein
MSSILDDQKCPRLWAQMQGDGGLGGLRPAGSKSMSTAVHHCTWSSNTVNFGDLTPYLTYGSNSKSGCWEFKRKEEQDCVDYRVVDGKYKACCKE